jgi:polysaccharide pyruvyl transferase WcaK-like protein
MNKHIAIFDTSIATLNVGDGIIMDAVNEQLQSIFPDDQHIRIPSHEKIGVTSLSIIRRSKAAIVGGSNILSSYMNKYRQWKLDPMDGYFMKNKVTLLGVGWRQYQGKTNLYTKMMLRRILCTDRLHSVRDSYTESRVKELGITNVINTGCPTMWNLTKAHCAQIPSKKADKVIFTLTDYSRNDKADRKMIEVLKRNYTHVSFWVQGNKDFAYFNSFGELVNGIKIVAPNLPSYNDVLEVEPLDYVGTRLHAGIRALQKKRRSIIIGIDNRAEEKRKDFGLPVLDRAQIDSLEDLINRETALQITLPEMNINLWKKQFQSQTS